MEATNEQAKTKQPTIGLHLLIGAALLDSAGGDRDSGFPAAWAGSVRLLRLASRLPKQA